MKIDSGIRYNLYTYAFLLLVACMGIYYGNSLLGTHENLRIWDIGNLAIMLLGIPLLLWQKRAGLPDLWETGISGRWRFLYPLGIGLFFGLLDVLVFKMILHPEPYAELPPFLQPFPYSIFLYLSGAFEVEVFYRLIPLTLILLLGASYKKGRHMNAFFWVAAILTSLREPLEQLSDTTWVVMMYTLVSGFFMNLLQALLYRKAGFLSSLSIRLGHYLFWHILLGMYVEWVELV